MNKQLLRLGTLCLLLMLSMLSKAATVKATWDFTNADVVSAAVGLSGTSTAGTIKAVEDNGILLTVEANGQTIRNNGNSIQTGNGVTFKVPVVSVNDVVTVTGYAAPYFAYAIGGTDAKEAVTTHTANANEVAQGYVEVVNKGQYLIAIQVEQDPEGPKTPQKITLKDEAAKATFIFNTGAEGQKAEFSNADYFITSKVTYGSNLILKGLDANGIGQTQFEPLTQQNESEGGTAADESNAIRFLIQPGFGFAFTPTKVSVKTTRYGTDNGLLDFSWQNPDKSTVSLAVGVKPNRNNDTQKFSELSYDITGATPGEGTCGLLVNLYHLQSGKQIGFSDIVIEGTLSGTEKEVPVLATLTINGKEYTAAEIFDDAYEAEFELSKKADMISEKNPVSATAAIGEVGTITYEGDNTKCTVTIPMSSDETNLEYVLNIIQKPDFTLTYIDTDKQTVLGTQQVEKDAAIEKFDIDFNEATAIEGSKVRGWFEKTAGGKKYTTDYVVTGDISLYAVATEIEEVSNFKKYTFDLTSADFHAEDHEAFNPSGTGYYYHDGQHGWAFQNGNKVDLLVGPKATVSVTLCRYGKGSTISITDASGKEIGTLPAMNKENVDGEIVAFNYEGQGGTITLNMIAEGEMYIHGMKIVNTAETNYESQGNWYFVKAGNAGSLLDVLDVVNGINANKDAERAYIFLPNGTYDLNETVKIPISGHNISIIGQSMDKTIIKTAPDRAIEGLGSADMFQISGSNLYMQDITLWNALDYYGALGGGQVGGRAAVIQDSGNRTIGKRIKMLSYQDTYYSSNSGQQAYYEDCDIHGTVDFICGGGDVRFQNTTISLEPRNTNGSGGRTVVAPTTNTKFGYVFDNCKVVDLAQGKGNWNFGRTWQNTPVTVYLNTTLDENAQKTLVASRWTEKGMNNKDPKLFGEFNTMDASGNNITPASNIIHSHGGDFETIINAEQAAAYTYELMFSENTEKPWDPAALCQQLDAPANLQRYGTTLTWDDNADVAYWVIVKDEEAAGIATSPIFTIDDDADADYMVFAANKMGGLSEPAFAGGHSTVTLSKAGYATFYDAKHSYAIPERLKAYVVTAATTDALTYQELEGVIPAGTAVMLESVSHSSGNYRLAATDDAAAYTGDNLLYGSDEATTTTADAEGSLFYKLAYGPSGTSLSDTFGWFWGAQNGAAFQIEAHRAWLAIPQQKAAAPGYRLAGSTTGISATVVESADRAAFYNLQGQRVSAPRKGIYIHNGKKVVVK